MTSKTARSRELGVYRGFLCYRPKKPEKDWKLKCQIEEVLRQHPSYGSPRLTLVLKRNHKAIERVKQLFGLKAYRRRGKKYKKTKKIKAVFTTHAIQLALSALMSALHNHPRPTIFHSDNGSEYNVECCVRFWNQTNLIIKKKYVKQKKL